MEDQIAKGKFQKSKVKNKSMQGGTKLGIYAIN
jgi:hypothetical protein